MVCAGVPPKVCGALSPPLSQPASPAPQLVSPAVTERLEPLVESFGEGHGALLVGVRVPCGQSRSLYISSNVLGVSLHREGVRTIAFLSFACKSMSEARSLRGDNQWVESVVSPHLKLPISS